MVKKHGLEDLYAYGSLFVNTAVIYRHRGYVPRHRDLKVKGGIEVSKDNVCLRE